MTKKILVDAGPLVAWLSAHDEHHEACTKLAMALQPPLLTCWPVIIECAYLLRSNFEGINRLIQFFAAGLLELLEIETNELPQILEIMKRYRNLQAGIADASLVYLAERESISTVFTLDRRDFSIYRIFGKRAFTIVP